MTEAEMTALTPLGYRFVLLFAAYLKYGLEREADPHQRLWSMEALETLGREPMPIDAIKTIAPMPTIGIEIMDTAFALDRDSARGCENSYHVLTRNDVFEKLCDINPSLKQAIFIFHHRR
jgi:hypothetical protein